MLGSSSRDAGFPGERFTFEVGSDAASSDEEIRWIGGGEPAHGTGRTFSTRFRTGGTFRVSAKAGASAVEFAVTICPIDEWLERARAFYGPSIDLSKVDVGASRLVLGPAGTAWTCNDVIRFKRPRGPEDLPHESTLIHELGHVWEHQNGQMQLLRGAIEQIGRLFGRDPYDYGGPVGVKRATELTSFSKEGQAQIVTEHWKSKHGYVSDQKGVSFTTPGYVEDLERLVVAAGIGTRPPTGGGPFSKLDAAVARIVNAVAGRVGEGSRRTL